MFSIELNLNSIKDIEKGWGNIYLQINNYSYPEKNWQDFIPSIISMWGNEYIKAKFHNKNRMSLDFMGGNRELFLSLNDDTISFLIDEKKIEVNKSIFEENLLTCFNSLSMFYSSKSSIATTIIQQRIRTFEYLEWVFNEKM